MTQSFVGARVSFVDRRPKWFTVFQDVFSVSFVLMRLALCEFLHVGLICMYLFVCRRPCIAKRVPTTVVCSIPRVAPSPPSWTPSSADTFFYTTLPHQPMSFTVHPDWASELFVARRIQLQKRDGPRAYRYTNFSFVY